MYSNVQTVTGPISKSSLGITSTHEHLLIDFSVVFQEPKNAVDRLKAFEPVALENLNWVRYDPFRNRDNLMLLDEEIAVEELGYFKSVGGNTIVDTTTTGIGKDPAAVARIARKTGLNIIIGTGYYVGPSHPPELDTKSVGDITEEIIKDIEIGDSGVRAGVIGEIGCSWPLWDNEKKVLEAAAIAQAQTGASIIVHPGRSEDAPFEILNILDKNGAQIERVVIGHLGRTYFEYKRLMELARSGCFLAYDQFGWETSNFSLGNSDFPSDAQRIQWIKHLIEEGFVNQILVGQDVCSKDKLVRFGGYGFAHLIKNIVPRMLESGFTGKQIDLIFTDNPAEMLAINEGSF